MNFGFTEEQDFLRDAVRKFIEGRASIPSVREWMTTEDAHSPELWSEMAGLGWLGLLVDEAHGGAGLGWEWEMSSSLLWRPRAEHIGENGKRTINEKYSLKKCLPKQIALINRLANS